MTNVLPMPRYGGRPNKDRVMISFYISRAGKQSVADLAAEKGQTMADTYRELLALGMQHVKRDSGKKT